MTTLLDTGDALRGDRIAITARRLSKPAIVNQSGRHKTGRIIARDNVYCVIEMPLTARPPESIALLVQTIDHKRNAHHWNEGADDTSPLTGPDAVPQTDAMATPPRTPHPLDGPSPVADSPPTAPQGKMEALAPVTDLDPYCSETKTESTPRL